MKNFFEDVFDLALFRCYIKTFQNAEILTLVVVSILVSPIFIDIGTTNTGFIEGISEVPRIAWPLFLS